MSSSQTYYFRDRGKVLGPYDARKLRTLARRGRFRRHHEVSTDGKRWHNAAEFPDLFPTLNVAPQLHRPNDAVNTAPSSSHEQEQVYEVKPVDDPGLIASEPASEPENSSEGGPARSGLHATGVGDDLWWYCYEGESENGPVAFEMLQSLAQANQLARTDFVWKEGMADWVRADQLGGLFSSEGDAVHTSPRTSSFAVSSLVFGVLGILLIPPVLGSLIAVIFGHIAASKITRSRGVLGGRNVAAAGLALGYVGLPVNVAACGLLIAWLRDWL